VESQESPTLAPTDLETSGPSSSIESGAPSLPLPVAPSDHSKCQRVELAKDDFEHGLDSKWICGVVASHPSYSNFATSIVDQLTTPAPVTDVDRADGEGCDLSRFFEVSPIAENVILDFMSYAWCGCGDIAIVACNTTIDIDRNIHRGESGGTSNGIVWRRENVTIETDADSSQHADRVQKISLYFPSKCYIGEGGLDVKFLFRNIDGVDNHIGGIDNLTLTASICAPTPIPTYPTPFPSIAPTTTRQAVPDACIAGDDGSSKECEYAVTTDGVIVGRMCLEVAQNSTAVHFTVQAYRDWILQTVYMWIGEDLSHSPMSSVGYPSIDEFPIKIFPFGGKDQGQSKIDGFVELECLAREAYYRQGIAYLQMVRVDSSGSVVPDSETFAFVEEHSQKTIGLDGWYGWFDFVVDCDCVETAIPTSLTRGWPSSSPTESIMPSFARSPSRVPTATPTNRTTGIPTGSPSDRPTATSNPTVCIEADTGGHKECHGIMADDGMHVGNMCLEVGLDSPGIRMEFNTVRKWRISSHHIWVGESVVNAPRSADGSLNVLEFPYNWSDSQGLSVVTQILDSHCSTNMTGTYAQDGIVQLVLQQVDASGDVVQGSEKAVFVQEYSSGSAGSGTVGWFDYRVNCNCTDIHVAPSTSPTAMTSVISTGTSTEAPTTSPKGFPTVSPTGLPTTLSPTVASGHPSATPTTISPTTGTFPSLPPSTPAATATGSPSSHSVAPVCLFADGEVPEKCFNIVSASGVRVGEACTKIIPTPHAVAIDFLADPGWAFLEHLMWTGKNLDFIRRTSSGGTDLDMFPYRSENQTGTSEWRAFVSIKCRFSDARAYVEYGVAEITLSRKFANGTLFGRKEQATVEDKLVHLSDNDRWLNYFSWGVRCDCLSSETSQPSAAPIDVVPQAPSFLQPCVKGPRIDQNHCQNMISEANLVVGQVCAELDVGSKRLQVKISAGPYWSFLQHQVWVGPSLQEAPKKEGLLDYKRFPYFWCDSNITEGNGEWSISLDVPCDEQSGNGLALYVIARSKAVQTLDGNLISETGVFALSHEPYDTSSWFNVPVHCDCQEKQPTQSPGTMQSPVNSPTDPPGLCNAGLYLDGIKVVSTKRCKILTTGRGIRVGDVCLELTGSNDDVEVSFIAASYWTFSSHHLWIGSFVGDIPRSTNGSVDYDAFPYFFCDSSGKKTWTTKVRSLCHTSDSRKHTLSLVSRSEAEQVYTVGGESIPGTMEEAYIDDHKEASAALLLGWLDFDIECSCHSDHKGPAPVAPPIRSVQPIPPSTLPGDVPSFIHDNACIEGDEQQSEGQKCHPILIDTSRQVVGTVCASVKHLATSPVQVVELKFTANEGWVFVQHQMWLDSDVTRVPKTESGHTDVSNFPFFWNNSTGSRSWKTVSTLKCNKHRRSKYVLTVIAQSSVVPANENTTLGNQVPLTAFGIEHDSSRGLMFGWMDFVVNCDCEASLKTPTVSPSLLPQEHTESPTLPPTAGDMCLVKDAGNYSTCHELQNPRGIPIGAVCAEEGQLTLAAELVFIAREGWRFISHQVWLGLDPASLPVLNTGEIDFDEFPHRWNISGVDGRWSIPIESFCLDGNYGPRKVYLASRSLVLGPNGVNSPTQETTEWTYGISPGAATNGDQTLELLYFEMKCKTRATADEKPITKSCDEPSSARLEGAICGKRRINLAGECAVEPTGTIELALDETRKPAAVAITVQFQASPGRYFLSASLWLGRDMSQMPRRPSDRMPDVDSFPLFLSDSTGYNLTHFRQELELTCSGGEKLTYFGVAHAVIQDATLGEKQEVSLPLSSYGYTHDGDDSTGWFGFFDYVIHCHCSSPSPIQSEIVPWPQRNGSSLLVP
jgi:hypothetical protein